MKIVGAIFKWLFILIGVVLLAWGVIIGLVFTPEVLTPQVVDLLQKHTKSEVSIKSVDLSLFTRFPNVTLRIDSLRIAQTKDSISDLVFARQCRLAIDPVALMSKKLQVNHFSLRGASIYVYVDSLNGPIKTFILPEQSEPTQEVDSLSGMDVGDYSLSIRRLKIDSTQIVIDDRTKQFYTRIENFGIDMSMNLSSTVSDLEVKTAFSNLIVWHAGDLLVKKTSMDLRSQMLYDRDSMQLSFERARVKLNGIDLRTKGTLRRDTINNGVQVDMKALLDTPSLTEFLALIPSSVVDAKDKITADGSVVLKLAAEGLYSDNSIPIFNATLKIDNANAKYESRKLALERVDCDAHMYVDLNEPKNSYADVKSLYVNTSEILDLTLVGRVDNMIEDPVVDMSVSSKIDFDRFTEVFPLNEGIICKGSSSGDLKAKFKLSDVENRKFADLYINGESNFTDLEISFDASKFEQDTSSVAYIYMQAKKGRMLFGDKVRAENDSRTLRSKVNFTNLEYRSKTGEYLAIQDIELSGGANFDRATSDVNGVGLRGVAKNMEVGVDSLFKSTLESSDITIIVIPQKGDVEPKVRAKINSQQVSAHEPSYNSDMTLSSVDMSLSMSRLEPKKWDMEGSVAFSDLGLFTDLFPLQITVPETNVSVSNKTIYLNNARVKMGESELVATGNIHNLLTKLFVEPRAALSGELAIKASMMNFNEIIEASNSSVLMLDSDEYESDTEVAQSVEHIIPVESDSLTLAQRDSVMMAQSTMFLVPRRMSFTFDLDIDKAILDKAEIEGVEGRAKLDNGTLTLDKLALRAIGAQTTASMVYRNINRESSNIFANVDLVGAEIGRLDELMPDVKSMFPMVESFEGVVDLNLKLNANIDSNSDVDYTTLCSAVRFKGKNLVLMDSETFADLSKTLMFKNKERNMIDSLEVFALISESTIDVLPFSMSIDRYIAYIGGTQTINPETFDVDYAYNVSIIKSPLPFKAGVDITGDLNDYKFKITKAKLKKTDFDQQRQTYMDYLTTIDASSDELQSEIDARRAQMQAKRRAQRAKEQEEAAQQEAQIEQEEAQQPDSVQVAVVADSVTTL
ncbi:MAG: AsmA family protein [Rikenellaceae bacterium]